MLGCHDFCGYYDWTFHHVRSTFGNAAVRTLWSEAIGGESQQAYADAARNEGLRGLLNVWNRTGEDEHCDWTFTLDEAKNVLRWDMRQCPSKGFLLDNDLHADEDYCDHCIGWIAPLLARHGMEMAGHEHNHRGQCWGEMRVRGKPYQPLDLPIDIRRDARWRHGHFDTFAHNERVSADPADVILAWFEGCDRVIVLTDEEYRGRSVVATRTAVVVGDDDQTLRAVCARWLSTPLESRPLLLHAYFPRGRDIDFAAVGLPRPTPILPLLIRAGVYAHVPGQRPSLAKQARLVMTACQTYCDGHNLPSSMGVSDSSPDVLQRVQMLLRRDLKLGGDVNIAPEMPFFGGDIDLDSLDILLLVTSVEKEFGVKIPSEKVGKEIFQTVATLVSYIQESLSGASSGVSTSVTTSPTAQDPLSQLPHGPEFRFVTRVITNRPGDEAVGAWDVKGTEEFFKGHFPDNPLVPGVLIAEALAQMSGFASPAARDGGKGGMLAKIEVRFTRPVAPPAQITLRSKLSRVMGELQQFDVSASVGDETVASGTITLHRPAS